MEEQKQAEQQWNKIRRERINILKEAPSEENLWQAVMAFQDYPFKTVTGLPFQYTLKTGKNGEWTKELWIDRREKSKSLSWSSVVLAFKNSRKTTECAKRFAAFGCQVVGIDLYPGKKQYYQKMLHLNMFDDVLPQSDIIVLTLPLTEETHYLMNNSRFEQLKEGVILVNIARGAVIDTEALINHLDKLGGAVLDVFEEEPLPEDNKLWDREEVILIPHNSFVGENNQKRLSKIIMENLKGK